MIPQTHSSSEILIRKGNYNSEDVAGVEDCFEIEQIFWLEYFAKNKILF